MNTSLRRLLLTVIAAPAAALAVWALAVPLAGAALTVRTGGATQTVGPVSVIVASLVVGLAGWALLAVLERRVARPGRVWTITALVVLVLSLFGPLGSAAGLAATLVLMLLHLVVGAVLVAGLARR
ncbi:DUF6069 family protein [Nonomuraea jabiensis]|uniref:Lysylphosphatidylglycerol synthetase-like protein (DUF2156 family) n=1 Tax=Nonomuraea jabiensis TaxID=882448 RepID=A0A7W9LFG8_9ACTN|nr:DUF6069 family protein [Nonomuraea jabiensis]MBB5781902.1 lysylphosphatidylglycerol synthetase-like protein (DUF2156 family) [Nonomuraea jabiensis]